MRPSEKKYEITILNWDKYQREMKGGEKRRRHREWVAISSRIYSDPDFLRLTMESRYLWLMLVCYAGAVGPVFKLCPSDARVLFKLRRNAVFQPLIDQGFIDLHTATNKTVQDMTNTIAQKKNATPKNQPETRFEDFWKLYPKKKDKKKARAVWERDKLDRFADEILANLSARTDWNDPKFIPHPTTYLNGERWTDEVDSEGLQMTTADYAAKLELTQRPDESDERFAKRVQDAMITKDYGK